MGKRFPPIEIIKLYGDEEWENFITEWVNSLDEQYIRVERLGGAGDMGRDVVAYINETEWDNYQCKHYDHPLYPSDIWIELGKLVYYTYIEEFSCPKKYYFIAPQGVGTSLSNFLKKPDLLKSNLIENWDKHCKSNITDTLDIPLDESLRVHLDNIDFSIFGYIPPLTIIDQHATTRYHVDRFDLSLPTRPPSDEPPETPSSSELPYIEKLMEAYGDHKNCTICTVEDIHDDYLREHYKHSRIQFYSAESLKNFSRDSLPEGEFEKLQEDIYDGVRDEMHDEHDDGYKRVRAVVKTAHALQISHPLVPALHVKDRGGICHQLANDKDEVRWVRRHE
jgi:hypothetical protein